MSHNKCDTDKYTWCRAGLGIFLKRNGYKVTNELRCYHGLECRNAHSSAQLVKTRYNQDWEKFDKSEVDLYNIFLNVRSVIENDKKNLKNDEYIEMIGNYKDLDIVELLNVWFEVACYQRRIINKFKYSRVNTCEGYKRGTSIPGFYIDNEEYIWSFQRTFNMCKDHQMFVDYDGTTPLDMKKICVGSFNCKFGVHNLEHLVCKENLLTGKCSCMSLDEFTKEKETLVQKIGTCSDEDKKTYTQKLRELKRKVHYTELGMLHFNASKEKYLEKEKVHFDTSKLATTRKLKKKNF